MMFGDSHAGTLDKYFQGDKFWHNRIRLKSYIIPGVLSHHLDYNKLNIDNTEGKIILAYVGECDIRNYLGLYDNTYNVVSDYVKKTQDRFPNNKIYFIQPVPQHPDSTTSKHLLSYELRYEQQCKFYDALSSHGVNIIDNKNVIGTYVLSDKHTNDQCHYNDFYIRKLMMHIYEVLQNDLVD